MQDNLWDFIQQCPVTKENGMFPVRDATTCRRSVQTIIGVGAVTCADIQTCMQSTVNDINNSIAVINGSITVIQSQVANLLAQAHTHPNKPILDIITNTLPPTFYLAGDGTYKSLPQTASYYQTVHYSGMDMTQRLKLIVGQGLVAEDTVNGTIIRSQCPCGGSSEFCASVMGCPDIQAMQTNIATAMGVINNFCGTVASCPAIIDMRNDIDSLISGLSTLNGTVSSLQTNFCGLVASCPFIIDLRNDVDALIASSSTDDYVNGGSFNPFTNILTLNRVLGGQVNVSFAGIITSDELVKVGPSGNPRYLNTSDFQDTGTDIVVKKQMSITSDASGLRLVGDQASPGNNMLYGTNSSGVKGRYANTGIEVSLPVGAQTTVVFPHNLNKRANIVCVDALGFEVIPGSKQYTDANTVILTFTPAFTGVIYAN